MKLVQKLPLGLALAACMMMSSCSQEDVQVAAPENAQNGFSNERGGGPLQSPPKVSTTNGTAGNNVFATGWEKHLTHTPDNLELYATGTSTKTHLWGDPNFPWTKPLLNPPGYTIGSPNNFITIMAQQKVLNEYTTSSVVRSKITNLKPGKKYAITVSVASSVYVRNGVPTQYAPSAGVSIQGTIGGYSGTDETIFDLSGKQAEWVTKTIIFVAEGTETNIIFGNTGYSHTSDSDKILFYNHLFVGQNAIVEVP